MCRHEGYVLYDFVPKPLEHTRTFPYCSLNDYFPADFNC